MNEAMGDTSADVVHIERRLLHQLLAEARAIPDVECCGLFAGRDGRISVLLPAREGAHRATTYEIVPAELFSLFRRMRDENLEHLGIYHSHPRGDNAPSERDVALAYYPEIAVLYCFAATGMRRTRCARFASRAADGASLQSSRRRACDRVRDQI